MKACLWYLICKSNNLWASPSDWVYYSSGNTKYQLELYSDVTGVAERYWISFYTSVIFIKGNEIGPRPNIEIIICSFILLLDLIVAGNIFGSVTVLV